jgi:hypothetical protein
MIETDTLQHIQLTNTSLEDNTLTATLEVYPAASGSKNRIYVGKRDVHHLIIQISSSNSTEVRYYTDLTEWKSLLSAVTLDDYIPATGAGIDLTINNITEGMLYTITVTGCCDQESGEVIQIGTTSYLAPKGQ